MQQNLQQRCNQFETIYNLFFLQLKLWSIQNLVIIANLAFAAFSEGDELPSSASGGNQIGGEIIRNKQCPHEADLRRLRMRKWGKPLFARGCRPAFAENHPLDDFPGAPAPPEIFRPRGVHAAAADFSQGEHPLTIPLDAVSR